MQEIDEEIDIAKRCDEWRRDYMTFALELERFKEDGRTEGILENTLASIRSLMKTMNLTAQQAMEALQIPASEQEKYLAMI